MDKILEQVLFGVHANIKFILGFLLTKSGKGLKVKVYQMSIP
jgi:hypothetical protein